MRWIVRGILFVLVGWLAAQTATAKVVTVVQVDAELLRTLFFVGIVAGLYGLLDWGRTAEYRIRQLIDEMLAEREHD